MYFHSQPTGYVILPIKYRRRFVLAKQKMTMTGKKFCLFMFFGIFATHLVYLGELSQIKYTAVKNKSLHYR